MKKPIIGITTNQFTTENGVMAGTKRQFVSNAYVDAILLAGGVPLLLPIVTCPEGIRDQLAVVDGLLLTGGGDVQPQIFGEEPVHQLGKVLPERDTHEINLVKLALGAEKAILGICRGCQVLNIALGGTVYQHLPPQQFTVQHDQNSPGDYAGHTIYIEEGSKLAGIFGVTKLPANSFHHQAAKELGKGLTVSARSKDNVFEAIEHTEARFIMAVQWHPELMLDSQPLMRNLFAEFVQASQR